MRPRPLTYLDAVELLDGRDSRIVRVAGDLMGLAAAGTAVATVGAVDFFALRDEIVNWGQRLVAGLHERMGGLRRVARTERLIAAHSVLVVTAFYEALEEVLQSNPDLDFRSFQLTPTEQLTLATGNPSAKRYEEFVRALIAAPFPVPAAHQPFEVTTELLKARFKKILDSLHKFLTGLSAFENKNQSLRLPFKQIEEPTTKLALKRYSEGYRTLAAQVPEFGIWAGMVDAQATRAVVRESLNGVSSELYNLKIGLRDMAILLAGTVGHPHKAALSTGLATRYRAQLTQPILPSAQAPEHVVLPTLGDCYVNPRGRVALAGPADSPATETWWKEKPLFDDLQEVILGHLTSMTATTSPLVLLGQPGSGKSVLTRTLAAQLLDVDFLPIRVELRNVPADTSIQTQIEDALYQTLGERVAWPRLAGTTDTALPVVIMDGFDELLQVTGTNRADYLEEIKEFQAREAELNRPVAVLVTSRTVVADRTRFPADSVVVKLEPFDTTQVQTWLSVWNAYNEAALRRRSLLPLPAEVALTHAELAEQPLLLLLLALYDASDNSLQRAGGSIRRVELYEQLFSDFISREVAKHVRGDPSEERRRVIEIEWRRLCAVALSMFNRSSYVVTEAELNRDLPYLLLQEDSPPAKPLRTGRALTVGQLIVGRFFFIHESQASRDTGLPERSFEFLHATFSDFLTARLIVEALSDLADERIHQQSRQRPSLDAGFFYAALSFATITRRGPLRDFCYGMLTGFDDAKRMACRDLLLELLPEASFVNPTWSLGDYEPQRFSYTTRHATFSANLITLAVMLSDGPVDVAELVGEPVTINWRQQALLWHSQLHPEDWRRLWQAFRVCWRRTTRSTLFIEMEKLHDVSVYDSLPWPPDAPAPAAVSELERLIPDVRIPAQSRVGGALRRSAFLQTTIDMREYMYALIPYWDTIGDMQWWTIGDRDLIFDGQVLMGLLLGSITSETLPSRIQLYRMTFNRSLSDRFRLLVRRQLANDMLSLTEADLVKALLPQGRTTILAERDFLVYALAELATQLGGDAPRVRALYYALARELHSGSELLDFQDAVWGAFGEKGLADEGRWIIDDVYGER